MLPRRILCPTASSRKKSGTPIIISNIKNGKRYAPAETRINKIDYIFYSHSREYTNSHYLIKDI